jgi:hypothetical protein
VTGKAVGLGLFETLSILGRASALERIDRALSLGHSAFPRSGMSPTGSL